MRLLRFQSLMPTFWFTPLLRDCDPPKLVIVLRWFKPICRSISNRTKWFLSITSILKTYIRNSKKAFISIVDDSIIQIGLEAANCGYNGLRNYLVRRKLGMNMSYCRKIFATYLQTKGIEQETIDLLQGRIPKSVFARHYFRPDFENIQNEIRNSINILRNEIRARPMKL